MKEAQAQMGLEGGRVEGRSSYRRNLQVQTMGEVKVWVCSHQGGQLTAWRWMGNQKTLEAGGQVEVPSWRLRGLAKCPSSESMKDFEEETFLTSAVTWEDHPKSNVHTKMEEWKPEPGRQQAELSYQPDETQLSSGQYGDSWNRKRGMKGVSGLGTDCR